MRKQIVLTHEGVEGSPLYVGTSGSSWSGTRERTGQLALLMKDGTHANTGPPSASGNVTQTMQTLTDLPPKDGIIQRFHRFNPRP